MKYILTLYFVAAGLLGFSQKHPVRVQTTITPPYSAYLSDYFAIDNSQLRVNLLFTDLSEPSWDVKLKFSIEGNGIKITTNPQFVPEPVNLASGVPIVLQPADLADYFNFNNLVFTGSYANELLRNGRLKEGLYRFCFEALDYQSGKSLSQVACANVWVTLKEPPYVINPIKGTHINTDITQNIPFQWQMANDVSGNLENPTEYQLSIFEVTDPNIDPMYAISSNKVLPTFTSDWTTETRFVYDMGAPVLDIGKKYAYRVQARNETGISLFKNEGFSEVGWFYYGYPNDGYINLSLPENAHAFGKNELQNFKWVAPDNLLKQQQYYYQFKIVMLEENQLPEQAIEVNEAWHEEKSITTSSISGKSILLNKPIPPNKKFAWQIKAFTGEQEIAASPVFTFDGPPILESFYAGKHLITVKSTKGDLNSLSGVAMVPYGQEKFLEVPFRDLTVEMLAGNYVLRKGELTLDLSNKPPMPLDSDYEANGEAHFHLKQLKLDKDNLRLLGQIKWPLPHPVNTGELAYVTSKEVWMDYNEFSLNGLVLIENNIAYDLLDPSGFTISLYDNSDFLVNNNTFKIRLNGHISLPQKIEASYQSGRIEYPFKLKEQLYTFDFKELGSDKKFDLGNNTGINIQPNAVIIDFSETESPENWVHDPGKKGVYLKNFDINFPVFTDSKNQLVLAKQLTYNMVQHNNPDITAWIGGKGLDLNFFWKFEEGTYAWFNQFTGELSEINLSVSESRFLDTQDNYLKGVIAIPLFSTTEEFAYTIPIRNGGFMPGSLDESLAGRMITFSEGNIQEETNLEVVQAHFANKDRLALTVNLTYEAANVNLKNVSDLNLWGDGSFGFKTPDGAMSLTRQTKGLLSGNYELEVDSVKAVHFNNTYALGIKAGINLGQSVSNPNQGLPRIDLISGKERNTDANPVFSGIGKAAGETGGFFENAGMKTSKSFATVGQGIAKGAEATVEAAEKAGRMGRNAQDLYMAFVNGFGYKSNTASQTKYVWTIPVYWKFTSGWAVGVLNYVENQGSWGDFWQGVLHVSLEKPFKATMDGQLVLGKKDGTDYWLVKLGAKSKDIGVEKGQREGIKVGPLIITELKGSIYHHMKNKEEVEVQVGENINDTDLKSLGGVGSYNDFENGIPPFKKLEFEDIETFDLDQSYYSADDFLSATRKYRVDKGTAYGGNMRLQLIDKKSKGELFTGTFGADLEYTPTGDMQSLHLMGSVGLSNERTTKSERKSKITSDFIGGGSFYYFPANNHYKGSLNLQTNRKKEESGKKPMAFCLKANATFESTSPSSWQLDLGNRYDRIIIDKGCQGMKYQGWLGFGTERLDAGLGILFQRRFETGWIDLEIAKFNAAAEVGFQSTFFVGFDIKPEFRFREGGVEVEAWANVKIDYQSFFKDGSMDLIDARLKGMLFFKDVRGVYHFYGSLNGHAKVLGVGVGFELNSSIQL
ncbi:hypothetical protein [Flexithrix dorotheae]|uniref:hypothetical protein n=1 Tax=Flexithrix dorotheae TaxID=70993 RepID=UPI0012F80E2D|nr:hypothetical protein [Flexithrix dorotheae]